MDYTFNGYDDGKFYPCTTVGSHIMIGEGPGAGYTINVPWQGDGCGDADYNAVWDEILMPVARKFDPNLVMVSAGFDAAVGDPLGGCYVTPRGYGVMLKKLMELADGRLVIALEGGYNIESLEESSLACVKVLLGDTVLSSFEERPLDSTHQLINLVRKNLCGFWPVLADSAPGIQFQELRGNAVLNADRSFVDEYETSSHVLNEMVAQTAKDWSEVEEAMQSHPIPGFGKKLSSILDTYLSKIEAFNNRSWKNGYVRCSSQ